MKIMYVSSIACIQENIVVFLATITEVLGREFIIPSALNGKRLEQFPSRILFTDRSVIYFEK